MSHIVTIKSAVKDAMAVHAACNRLGLPEPVQGSTRLFSGEVTGLAVQLPEWQYPVIVDLATGQVHFDNFSGRWGDRRQLDAFLQMYAVEKARAEAQRHGHQVTESLLSDGSVKLTIQIAGGAQ